MFISQLFESTARQVIVIYPGRFQPFHLGHKEVFQTLQAKFGSENVYIGTSNKVALPKSPFNFSEKLQLMNAAGIDNHRVLEIAEPYRPNEYIQTLNFDPTQTVMIFAVGEPDLARLEVDGHYTEKTPTGRPSKIPPGKQVGDPKPLKSFQSLEQCVTADQHQYVLIARERPKTVNVNGKTFDASHGTQVRELWNQVRNDSKASAEVMQQLYGRATPEIAHILNKIPDSSVAKVPAAKPSPKLTKVQQDQVSEDAAGVGVVKNSKDPRYVMATMGKDNDVRGNTLAKMMKAYRLAEGIRVIDQDYDLDQIILTMDINGRPVSFTYTDYNEDFDNAERKDVHDQLQRNDWYATLSHPDRMEILDAAYRAIRGEEPGEYRPTVDDEPMDVGDQLDEKGMAEGTEDISSLIQQYEDMVELVYDLPPGRKKNIAIDRRDALEAQIEAMPGGEAALRKWAKSYNDAVDEGVAEGSDWGEPEELLTDVLTALERQVEWPLTDIMDHQEVQKLLQPVRDAVNAKMKNIAQGVEEGSHNIEVGDKITWYQNKFYPHRYGIVRKVIGNTVVVQHPESGEMHRLSKEDIRRNEKQGVAEGSELNREDILREIDQLRQRIREAGEQIAPGSNHPQAIEARRRAVKPLVRKKRQLEAQLAALGQEGLAEGSFNKKGIVAALVDARRTIKQVQIGQAKFPPGFASQLEIALYDAINVLRDDPNPGVQNTVAELSDLRAVVKQVQTGKEGFPPGFASHLEWVVYDAIVQIENQKELDEGWKQKLAALGAAGVMGMSSMAGAADRMPEPVQEPIIATISMGGETKTLDLSSKGFGDVKQASKWLERFLNERGIDNWSAKVERGEQGSGRYERALLSNTGTNLGIMREYTSHVGDGRAVEESLYQYNKQDPYDSEFAPDVGMGRMTLRGWKKSMIRRVKEFAAELERNSQDLDRAVLWDNVYKKLQSLNLDPIAQEIELAHQELEKIRRQGGIRSRAFNK